MAWKISASSELLRPSGRFGSVTRCDKCYISISTTTSPPPELLPGCLATRLTTNLWHLKPPFQAFYRTDVPLRTPRDFLPPSSVLLLAWSTLVRIPGKSPKQVTYKRWGTVAPGIRPFPCRTVLGVKSCKTFEVGAKFGELGTLAYIPYQLAVYCSPPDTHWTGMQRDRPGSPQQLRHSRMGVESSASRGEDAEQGGVAPAQKRQRQHHPARRDGGDARGIAYRDAAATTRGAWAGANSWGATSGKRVALSSGQAVAGSPDGGLAGGRIALTRANGIQQVQASRTKKRVFWAYFKSLDVLYMHLIFCNFFVIFGGYFAFAVADDIKAI
ncbi:hypothetical protein B0H14DRAFT_2623958 [Mycena olivaceomarginata]|nr:hypothetical protein B0H14DRAFT_2623958 [Mycena olivaceomarginata]